MHHQHVQVYVMQEQFYLQNGLMLLLLLEFLLHMQQPLW